MAEKINISDVVTRDDLNIPLDQLNTNNTTLMGDGQKMEPTKDLLLFVAQPNNVVGNINVGDLITAHTHQIDDVIDLQSTLNDMQLQIDQAVQLDNTDELPEGTQNLYYTDDRARAAISVSGDLNYDAASGTISYSTPFIPADIADLTDANSLIETTWAEVLNKPETATRFADWSEVTNKPLTATRWPTYDEVTAKPTDVSYFTNDAGYLTQLSVDELVDVSAATPAAQDVLLWNGTTWANGKVNYSDLQNIPAEFNPAAHTHVWDDLSDAPTNVSFFANDSNYLTALAVEELSNATVATPTAGQYLGYNGTEWENKSVGWAEVINKPAAFPPTGHTHDDLYYRETEVDSLLSGKSDKTHVHYWNEIQNRPTTLGEFTNDVGFITTYDVTQTDVTQYETALSLNSSQIVDFTEATQDVASTTITAGRFIDVSYDDVNGTITVAYTGGESGYDSSNFDADFDLKTTDDLSEGATNLYYTDARARASVSATGDLTYDPATGVFNYVTPDLAGDVSELTDTQNLLETTWAEVVNKPTVFPPEEHTHVWADITDRPTVLSAFTNDAGFITSAAVSDLTDVTLTTPVDNAVLKYDTGTAQWIDGQIDWAEVTGKPTTFTPSSHDHVWTDITDRPTNVSFFTNDAGYLTDLSAFTTDNLSEGATNLYYTDARAQAAITVSGDLSKTGGTISYTTPFIPSDTADLTNTAGFIDASYVTWANVSGKPGFHAVATSGDYNDLLNKPTIPTPRTDEEIQDVLSNTVVAGTDVSITYDDVANTLTFDVSAALTLNELNDVTTTAASTGDVLIHDGTTYKNRLLTYSDISDTPWIVNADELVYEATSPILSVRRTDNTSIHQVAFQNSGNAYISGFQTENTATDGVSNLLVKVASGTSAMAGVTDITNINARFKTDGTVEFPNDIQMITSATLNGTTITDWADIGSLNAIGSLSDVAVATPAAADVLRYDGTSWVNSTLSYEDLSNEPFTQTADNVSTTKSFRVSGTTPIGIDVNSVLDHAVIKNTMGSSTDNILLESWGSVKIGTNANLAGGGGQFIVGTGSIGDATFLEIFRANASGLDVTGSTIVSGDVSTSTSFTLNGSTITSWADVTGATDLTGLSDVTTTAAAVNEVLQYNGTNWMNSLLTIDDISGLQTALDAKADQTAFNTHVNDASIHRDITVSTSSAPADTTGYAEGDVWLQVAP